MEYKGYVIKDKARATLLHFTFSRTKDGALALAEEWCEDWFMDDNFELIEVAIVELG